LPFWENVYGFDMSCIGKEVTSTSARFPVVDVLSSQDIVTETAVLHVSSCNCAYLLRPCLNVLEARANS
jgi:hypothetical protein